MTKSSIGWILKAKIDQPFQSWEQCAIHRNREGNWNSMQYTETGRGAGYLEERSLLEREKHRAVMQAG